jgi:hypothetical protein
MWIEGAPREAVIGETLAFAGKAAGQGVDGQGRGRIPAPQPVPRRAHDDPGDGPTSGEWRISGVPFFAAGNGSFLGYRGGRAAAAAR